MKLLLSTAGIHMDRDLGSRVVNISDAAVIDVWALGWLTYLCVRSRFAFQGARGKAEHELLLNFSLLPSISFHKEKVKLYEEFGDTCYHEYFYPLPYY